MKILITAGGTREYIDDIRVLTNISSGKLGAKIATKFMEEKHTVYYLHSIGSAMPTTVVKIKSLNNIEIHDDFIDVPIKGVDHLMKEMKRLIPQVDIVIHSMAVSDFGFDKKENVKLKSNDPQAFIDYMRDTIKVNPKILSNIKEWDPNVVLVSFKFEVGKSLRELIDIAYKSLEDNNCDYVVANDKQEMVKEKKHIAYIIDKHKNHIKSYSKEDIANDLYNELMFNLKFYK